MIFTEMEYKISFPREYNKNKLKESFEQYEEVLDNYYEKVVFDLSRCRFIRPTGIVAIVSMMKLLKYINKEKDRDQNLYLIDPQRDDLTHYLNRINFYELMDIDREEIVRRNSRGRFFEVNNIKSHTEVRDISEDLAEIFRRQTSSSENLSENINASLSEILDNIFHHSRSPINGIVCAQTYPHKREAEFAICDTGIGIKKSLGKNPEYSHLESDMVAIEKALEKEVTGTIDENDVGLNNTGEGLYYIKEAIISNSGDLHIHSKKGKVAIEEGDIEYSQFPLWPGTIISITINLNNDFPLYENIDIEIEDTEEFDKFDF
mgnify:CR=1 FL=1